MLGEFKERMDAKGQPKRLPTQGSCSSLPLLLSIHWFVHSTNSHSCYLPSDRHRGWRGEK